jgi:hypothetical protein
MISHFLKLNRDARRYFPFIGSGLIGIFSLLGLLFVGDRHARWIVPLVYLAMASETLFFRMLV